MKKLLLLFVLATFISCETKTIEVEKSGGVWHMGGDEQFPDGRVLKQLLDLKVILKLLWLFIKHMEIWNWIKW